MILETTILDVRNITKSYKLYPRNRDRLLESLFPFRKKRHTDFFALKDINFSLAKGESLGIIGGNGSGKSTLLKIISGVLTPTSGTATVKGTMGCLLELGGGFNPELSGLENARIQLLLSGVDANESELLPSILEFADIGDFIRHPVKKYSSGMFMRLAFACATAISPSVLIVDEALAVGDVFFVKKCMNRMHQLLENGTTLLFVSHDLESVRRLCNRILFLDHGEQMGFGPTPEIAEQYVAFLRTREAAAYPTVPGEKTDESIHPLHDGLFHVTGAIDLAEQRLFITGLWPWYTDIASGLSARYSPPTGGKISFSTDGNRLVLSFLRGEGFDLPSVYIDHQPYDFSIENDLPFMAPRLAPLQVRNFVQTLPEGKHIISIVAENSRIAWLGGCSFLEEALPVYTPAVNWETALDERHSTIYGDRKAVLTNVELLDFSGNPVSAVMAGDTVRLRIHAERLGVVGNVSIGYKVHNRLSVGMFGTTTREEQYALNDDASHWVVEFIFTLPLKGGEYTISAAVASVSGATNAIHHYVDIAALVHVAHHPRRTIWGEFHNPTHIRIGEDYT